LEVTVCTSTFGVNHTLGDALTVEVSELLDQMYILQEHWTPFADSK
jgi:hypothetical protein